MKALKIVNLVLSIIFTIINLLTICLLIWENEYTFLYDISYIHKYRYIIIIVILLALTILIWFLKTFWEKIIAFQAGFLLINILMIFGIFGVSISKSLTNDINNYKKFDIQVQKTSIRFLSR